MFFLSRDGKRAIPLIAPLGLLLLTGCATTPPKPDLIYFPNPPNPARVIHMKSFNRLDELVLARTSLIDVLRGQSISPFIETPAGLACHDGHLYLCDTKRNMVLDWNLATGREQRIGNGGEPLHKPVAVAVDIVGRVYVADSERGEVVCFSPDGSPLRRYRPAKRADYRPVSVAIDDGSGRLYVADIASHQVDVYSIADDDRHAGSSNSETVPRTTVGGKGTETGRFYYPMGVAVGPDGALFVSDMMNSRVQVFDRNLQPLLHFGQPGNRYGDMGKPRHLGVSPDGVAFVADAEFAHVHLFNRQGQLLMLLGGPDDRTGGTPLPVGVAIARTLPEALARWVPSDFHAQYFVFVSNSVGKKRIGLYAVGERN